MAGADANVPGTPRRPRPTGWRASLSPRVLRTVQHHTVRPACDRAHGSAAASETNRVSRARRHRVEWMPEAALHRWCGDRVSGGRRPPSSLRTTRRLDPSFGRSREVRQAEERAGAEECPLARYRRPNGVTTDLSEWLTFRAPAPTPSRSGSSWRREHGDPVLAKDRFRCRLSRSECRPAVEILSRRW